MRKGKHETKQTCERKFKFFEAARDKTPPGHESAKVYFCVEKRSFPRLPISSAAPAARTTTSAQRDVVDPLASDNLSIFFVICVRDRKLLGGHAKSDFVLFNVYIHV